MKKKGISLIVLIVTIIVIIILAAVVILTLSKNNPIESAREAAFKEDVRTFQDELAMYIAKDYTSSGGQRDGKISATSYDGIKNYIQSFSKKYEGKFIIQNDGLMYQEDSLTDDEKKWIASTEVKGIVNKVPKEWRTYIADVTEEGVPIPKGFTYKEGTKATGVVIEDESHNEFVWVPVDNISEFKKEYSFSSNYNDVFLNTSDDILPRGILDETTDIEKYKGFYIGRYEATTSDGTRLTCSNHEGKPTCQKGSVVWTNIHYTNAKNSSEKMYIGDNLSVQSGLLTGKCWDTTCAWIKSEINSLNDSREYGNYSNSQNPANINGYGTKQVAGYSEKWMVKNIYDLAGNVWELTNESNSSNRVCRGGSAYDDGTQYSISYRGSCDFSHSDGNIGFRIRLYIKTA